METTLINLLKSIVNHPDDVTVSAEEPQTGIVIYTITAHEEDKGIIIGKGGRTIKALNDIIAVKAVKENKRVSLKVE